MTITSSLRFLYIFWGFGLLCGITMDWQALQIDWNVFNYLFFANYVLQKFYFCMDVSKDIWNFLYKAPRSLQKSLIWAEMTCFVTRARFVLILTKLKLGNWKCKQIFKVFKTDRRFEMLVPCCCCWAVVYFAFLVFNETVSLIETFQDFLIKLDMKPCMHLVEISIFH